MLWRKETNNRRYVDILCWEGGGLYSAMHELFTNFVLDADDISTEKDDSVCIMFLSLAQKCKSENMDPDIILEQANRALCFANINGEKCGMAYSFRAEIFHDLKQYSLCMADIEMAIKHKMPSRNLPLMEKLKNDCLKMLSAANGQSLPSANGSAVTVAQLSFPPNATIPCFAQGLQVNNSKKYGKHIVTNRKLEVAQTVIIEEAFCIRSFNEQNYAQCANCFERDANLIPCKNCAGVMFCSQRCHDIGHVNFHEFECGKRGVHTSWEAARRIVIQTVIHAIKLFPNIEELMTVIENFMKRERPTYADPLVCTYMQFFDLNLSVERTPCMQDMQFIDYAKTIHSQITSKHLYESKFRTLESKRFLGHLILHHFYIVDSMGVDAISFLHSTYVNKLGIDARKLGGFTYAHGIYLNSSQLNHSCQPNIARIFIGNKLIGKVIRPIKAGEQLFVSYLKPVNLLRSREYRAERLATIYYFRCECMSCTWNLPSAGPIDKDKLDPPVRQLVELFQQSWIGNTLVNVSGCSLAVNRDEMLAFEVAAIKFLRNVEHLQPITAETLILQFLLAQIWNNLAR